MKMRDESITLGVLTTGDKDRRQLNLPALAAPFADAQLHIRLELLRNRIAVDDLCRHRYLQAGR